MWCGGCCLTPLWCDWDHTSWCEVLVRGEKGKIDPYFTPPCPATLCADWCTIIHGIWSLCCALPPSHLSWMSPKASKSEPIGSKTCSSCLHWQALARLMEKVFLRKAKKTLGTKDMPCDPRSRAGSLRAMFSSAVYIFRCVSMASGPVPCWLL